MLLNIRNSKTKVGKDVDSSVKKQLQIDDSYNVEEQYFFHGSYKNEFRVFKINDGKPGSKNIGILATDNFFFAFDYDQCVNKEGDSAILDTHKINGWFQRAHGVRETGLFGGNHPFVPPEGDWNINFMGPSGSQLNSTFENSEDLLSLRTFGQWSREGGQVNQKVHTEGKKKLPLEDIQKDEKFKFEDKLVGGSKKHHDRIMNISMEPIESELGQNIQNISSLVESSTEAGFIYARNNKANLKGMLQDMHQIDGNHNLVVLTCRGYGSKTQWNGENNQGPTIAEALNITVENELHFLAQASKKKAKLESVDKAGVVLAKGVDVNKIDAEGNSALHYAVKNKNYDLVQLLLKHDAKLITKGEEKSLLVTAVEKRDMTLFELATNAIHNRYDSDSLPKEVQEEGAEAFKKACEKGNIQMLKSLLEVGVELTPADLNIAKSHAVFSKNSAEVKLFLEAIQPKGFEIKQPDQPFSKLHNQYSANESLIEVNPNN
ncbi:ankyrin repeat domain-containing protein [Thiotrichales bacterium 19X7-9]|nr:ankyrin repeat domain-containing protein [Thiotrichales bacterium 19X7-9]